VLSATTLCTTLNAQVSTDNCQPFTSSSADAANLVVGDITVNANDVFNLNRSGEQTAIHTLANRLHQQTRTHIIERQLLFKTGDHYKADKLVESERLLRRNDYLKSAVITPIALCGDAVNIEVTTRDHWSLIPKFTFTRSGGENRFGFEVTEANLFGYGKELTLAFQQGSVRDQKILEYKDKQILGSRKQLTLQWQDNTDGERQKFDLQLPFYAFDSTRAWRIAADRAQFNTRLYKNREVQTLFDIDNQFVDINVGRSRGLQGTGLHRYWLGARFEQTRLIDISADGSLTELPVRRFNYPYLAWQFQRPQFVKQRNLYMMDETEDVSLGHFFETRLGYASQSLDSTDDAFILSAEYQKGWQGGKSLGLFKTKLQTIRLENEWVNTIWRPQLNWFWFQSDQRTLFLSAKGAFGDKLFAENQFLAGGNNGLRGYPLRMQSGNKRMLLSAEQRWYLNWYPWRLLRIGAAAFIDVGSAWDDANGEDPDWLGNAGVGLRLFSSRQANAPITHIDLAVPFDQRDDIDSVQLVIISKAVF
jgi:outer membrane translocation and assembly module TamA